MSTAPETTPQPEKIQLTDQNVIDLLDCAGYGVRYWAASGTVDEEAKTYRVIERSEELPDDETPADKTLTFDEIRDAFNTLAKNDKLPDWQMREIADGELAFDSEVGDMTVQQAMFGEIVFG